MNMRNRQDEKVIIDDTNMDLQQTNVHDYEDENPLEMSHQVNTSKALDKSGSKSPDRSRSRVFNEGDLSMDYLNKVDDIEVMNRQLRKQLEKLEGAKEAEVEKQKLLAGENDKLRQRIQDLEVANQETENLVSEKHRQLEYELQLKEDKITALHEQLQEKQAHYREKLAKLEEELQVEKDNGYELDKVRAQKDQFAKVISGLKEGMEQFQEQKIELANKNEQIKGMEKEVAQAQELQSVVKMLREDLSNERQRCT